MEIKALLLTILVGIFFLAGMIIPRFFKNKSKLILFATGLTFTIMMSLIILDLIPETFEILKELKNYKYYIIFVIFIVIGLLLLKILDLFVPEHHHHHEENEKNINEHNSHLFHIGLITAISLSIHNILEGITIYITGITDLKLGLLMAFSVGCHNLPLGIEISASMNEDKNKKSIKLLTCILLVISSTIGALVIFLANKNLNSAIEGVLLSLTLGMLIYIVLFELFKEVKNNLKNKEIIFGLVTGLVISTILFLL